MDTIIGLAYTKRSHASWQNNLINLEVDLEPYQIYNIELYENSHWLKAVNYFCKALHLRCLTEFLDVTVICYSLFGKIEDANKMGSLGM